MPQKPKVGVIIAAGGSSNRMGGVDKLYARLGGKPVLLRATHAFQKSPLIDQIVVVVAGEKVNVCQQLIPGGEWSKVTNICAGGERRQDSVAAGLKLISKCDWVVIHDGARPLVTAGLINDGLKAAQETGAAIAAMPVKDTIKIADEDKSVRQTLNRESLWAIQTPQVFRREVILNAYRQTDDDVTDDAALVERAGGKVILYMGSYDNIKVTTSDDLTLAEVLIRKREQ